MLTGTGLRANINPYKPAFWMIAYIVFDPQLLATLRAEASAAYQDSDINLSCLIDRCPRLEAVYFETTPNLILNQKFHHCTHNFFLHYKTRDKREKKMFLTPVTQFL